MKIFSSFSCGFLLEIECLWEWETGPQWKPTFKPTLLFSRSWCNTFHVLTGKYTYLIYTSAVILPSCVYRKVYRHSFDEPIICCVRYTDELHVVVWLRSKYIYFVYINILCRGACICVSICVLLNVTALYGTPARKLFVQLQHSTSTDRARHVQHRHRHSSKQWGDKCMECAIQRSVMPYGSLHKPTTCNSNQVHGY